MPEPVAIPSAVPSFRVEPVSFARRGRRLGDSQQRLWDDQRPVYLVDVPRADATTSVDPDFVLDVDAAFEGNPEHGHRSAPSAAGATPLIVEIGSGQGDAVVAAAHERPGTRFLAIEVYEAGLAHTARSATRAGIDNLRLLQANAPEVLATTLAAGSVDELWIFFPDPWRKARHVKRRLVDAAFADLAARTLVDGGVLRFASDWEPYAYQARDVLDAHASFSRAPGVDADGWAPRFPGRVMTGFERKGLAAGRVVHDLAYVRGPRAGAADSVVAVGSLV